MSVLVRYIEELTGKEVEKRNGWWYQTKDKIIVSSKEGFAGIDLEGLIHECCHWIVATDFERRAPNLMLCGEEVEKEPDVYDPNLGKERMPERQDAIRSKKREHQAYFLAFYLFDRSDKLDVYWIENERQIIEKYSYVDWYREFSQQKRASWIGVVKRKADVVGCDLDEFQRAIEEAVA